MAIYHLNMTVISRKAGRSATASAAYRSGERIIDERTGEVHDYRRKHGVTYTEVLTPYNAPAWARNRATLWNAVEEHNRRADATVAREINIALPHELNTQQRRDLARGFARQIANRYQVAVDLAIHRPNGQDPRNYHAHLLLTTNRLGPAGLGTKARELDPIATAKAGPGANAVEQLRQEWAERASQALERAGQSAWIDHRTLKAQGIERDPTRHLGPAAVGYERRTGTPSRRHAETQIDPNTQREIAVLTRDLETTQQRLADLEEARRGRAQALAEERAEWEQRQARERQVQQVQEQKRIERMTAAELAAEIQRLTPRPVDRLVQVHPDVMQAYNQVKQLRYAVKSATESVQLAHHEAGQWRDEHPVRARLHDAGISQHYLAERDRIQSEQTQRLKSCTQKLEEADRHAHQVADRLHQTFTAEQAPIWTRIAELERLWQAKAAQEAAQERLQATPLRPPLPTPTPEQTAAQKPSQTVQERLQAAQRPQVGLEPSERWRPASERLQTAPVRQERSLTALEQEKARQLREAFETLDKRSAMLRYPELTRLYPLLAEAENFAKEKLHPANRADFVEGIKEQGIQTLAQGKTLPKLPTPSVQQESGIKLEQKRGQGIGR